MSQVRDATPVARPAGAAPAEKSWQERAGPIMRSVALFIGMQMAMKYGMSYLGLNQGSPAPVTPASNPLEAQSSAVPGQPVQPLALVAEPMWPLGTPMSMILFTSTHPNGADFDPNSPLLVWDNLTYGGWKDERVADLDLQVPESVRLSNGSWFLDVMLVKGGGSTVAGKPQGDIAVSRKQLTRFFQKRRVRKEKKLIGGDEEEETEAEAAKLPAQPVVAHWSRNLTLTVISDGGKIDLGSTPPGNRQYFNLAPTADGSKRYYPPVFPNDFWLMRENLWPINSTDNTLPLRLNYQAVSGMKFNIFAAMTKSFEEAAQQQGTGAEMDEIKRMLTETNPILLVTTLIVTILHMIFEFLAFSSDVSHWRKKDRDLVGVSLNTILTNCFVQFVILLYLQDSSEETSLMILFTQGIGLLIEAWKITKVVNVRARPAQNLIGYKITFEDKKVLSEEEKQTQQYDREAFKIVSYFAIPTLMGYTIYSLLYQTHRGWYSFIVSTLAQAIYMFGFVQLVPQLIINYKLKSVAHMPMKAMMYKTLSTVVDDFFAFCIRMPWLHRLACFRDDAVFVVLLYQRWIYRIDYSRVNEYGQVQEGMAEPVGDKAKAIAASNGEKVETKKDQ